MILAVLQRFRQVWGGEGGRAAGQAGGLSKPGAGALGRGALCQRRATLEYHV